MRPAFAALPPWLMSMATTSLVASGTASVPIDFDLFPGPSGPDVVSHVPGRRGSPVRAPRTRGDQPRSALGAPLLELTDLDPEGIGR
jgi:hypothetical protein